MFDERRPGEPEVEVDCALVVVTYNSAVDLNSLLDSVPAAAGHVTVHTTVVDNASADDVEGVVQAHDDVRLIRSSANLGYAGAINVALAELPPSTWVLVLNPDLTLMPRAIETLVEVGTRGGADVVVPTLLDTSGRVAPSLRREPALLRGLGEALLGDHLPRRPAWSAEIVRDPGAYRHEHAVEWATGAALLLRRTAVETAGRWDTRFFLYSEETDYFRRLREAGRTIRYTPAAIARHRGGGSGSSPQLVALLVINRVRYYRKWHGAAAVGAYWLVSVLHCLLRIGKPGERSALWALISRRARAGLPGPPHGPDRVDHGPARSVAA
ncbi:glycosyltransferase family 2 protein [Geodermatophilus sp. SYSU D00766]